METLYNESDRGTIQMVISLLKWYVRPEFIEEMQTDWKEVMSANELAIQDKVLTHVSKHWHRFDNKTQGNVILMIADMCDSAGMNFKEFDTQSQKQTLSIDEYNQLDTFIGQKAALAEKLHLNLRQHQENLFNLNEHLRVVSMAMIAKSTFIDGFERESMNYVYQTLLQTKSRAFFERGYIFDLLVHDRAEARADADLSVQLVNPEYLSTHIVTKDKAQEYQHMMLCEI